MIIFQYKRNKLAFKPLKKIKLYERLKDSHKVEDYFFIASKCTRHLNY